LSPKWRNIFEGKTYRRADKAGHAGDAQIVKILCPRGL
jgi:hypothetical protein